MPKGELHTGIRPRTRRRLLAVGAVALASFAVPAFAQKKPPAAPQPAARGAVVQYEEMKQSRILYLEETGGMMTRSSAPVAPEIEQAAPKASRTAANPEERSTSTGTGTSARRAAPRRDAGIAK